MTITTLFQRGISSVVASSVNSSSSSSSSSIIASYPMGGAIQGNPLNIATVVTTLAGTAGAAAGFFHPYGITTDGTNLYVADYENHTIRKIVIATGVVTTLAGAAGTDGIADGTGAEAQFNSPIGITTDGANLYVVDTNNSAIRKIVTARFYFPSGITTDGFELFVTDLFNNIIRKIH